MLFEQTTVGEFLQQTLVCQAETPIQDILDLLQHQSESAASPVAQSDSDIESVGVGTDLSQLVVVNERQQPISLIPLSQFIHLFFSEQHSAHFVSAQQPIAEWINLHNHPLQCVAATESLKQFWQYLQTFSQDLSLSWAIVEEATGQYLGLLDTPKLVQFLAHHAPLSVAIKFSSDLKSAIAPVLEQSDSPPVPTDSPVPPDSTAPTNPLSTELLAEISHELKSPLTAILSLSNVLSHQGIQNLTERQLQYVQLIHHKSQHLVSILNTLLDLTQLPIQAQSDAQQVIDLDLLCDDAIAQAKRSYRFEESTDRQTSPIIRQYPPNIHDPIASNELKLRQTLIHLLHNAMGLTRGQSTIELNVEQWQNWTIFTITDQGVAIPHLQQPLIFEVPQTWSIPDQDILGKTDLGLVLAQRLAGQLSGDLSFTSGPMQGNTFSLYVPSALHPEQKNTITRGLVLLISTNPHLISQVNQYCSEQSLRVIVARSESETRQKIALFKPQAVILQPLLTTGSGWEILSLLKRQDQACPILLIGSTSDCLRSAEMGLDSCLTFPELQPGLAHWFENHLSMQTPSPTPKPINVPLSNIRPEQKLTVLHLDGNLEQTKHPLPIDINQTLNEHQWRVISTTTLDEAEFLVNIWKPDVILYTDKDATPILKMTAESPLIPFPFVILHSSVQLVALERGDIEVISQANLPSLVANPELSDVSSLLRILNSSTATE